MSAIPANYFDGRQARPHPVTLTIQDGVALVSGDGLERRAPIEALEISPALGRTDRIVRFPDGGFCEISDHHAFNRLLAEAGVGQSGVAAWEGSRRWIAASIVAFIVIVILTYRYGIPVMARLVAERMPAVAVDTLDRHVLQVLDRTVFEPSQVPIEGQARIREQFAALDLPGRARGQRYDVVLRTSKTFGANAIALPSGTIVLTDELVALAQDDRELVAVLAHEAGHVDYRHGLRHMLQASAVALLIAWYVGDVSSLAATAPTALLEANYSRGFERDADDYAVRALTRSGIPLRHMADILERLESSHRRPGQISTPDYLSSHPATEERLQRLRGR
jgi:Zn-dependent protease with chaperone function